MAEISRQEVEHVARLARLALTEAEVAKFQRELSAVLAYVDKLKEVDTAHVPETAQVTGLANVFREDEVKQCEVPVDQLLKNAPATEGRYLKVKAILEGET
jgi:aspartyl-tRNA(Asn)/glutamyl-tRNA(Gln) amidotransferase subunit C